MRWLIVVVATLAFAPSAYAQGATVRGFDILPSSGRWEPGDPQTLSVKIGEEVTWDWSGTQLTHNVDATGGDWNVTSTTTSPFKHTFTTSGTYKFACRFHPAMTGSVTVSDASGEPPPPPPPPPPSEQQWPNDQAPPTVFELVDEVRPELTHVRVDAVRNGVRTRFRLSERARVDVRVKRAGVVVEAARRTFGAGPGRLTVRDRRMRGRYVVEVVARDLSGNRSAVERAELRVRR